MLDADLNPKPSRSTAELGAGETVQKAPVADTAFNSAATRGPSKLQVIFAGLQDKVVLDIVAAVDVMVVMATAVLAKFLYLDLFLNSGVPVSTTPYAAAGALVGVLAYANMRNSGVYQFERIGRRFITIRKIFVALITAFLLIILIGYMFKSIEQFSRLWAGLWFSSAFVSLVLWHFLVATGLKKLVVAGSMGRTVAVIGETECVKQVLAPLRADPTTHLSLHFSFRPSADDGELVDVAGVERFVELAQNLGIDNIVIAVPFARYGTIAGLTERLSVLSSNISLYNTYLSGAGSHLGTSSMAGMTLFDVQKRPLGPWSIVAKSAFDRIGAGLLLFAFSPVFLAAALAIKLDSPGPLFFRQRRSGLDHRVFPVYKFRTMTVTEDGDTIPQAQRHDPRVTRVGGFLRRYSIDELPQLVNVLKGDMSLVGPRPHAIAHNAYYATLLERYANRHRVKPGMTGWAQVNGFRGATDDPDLMKKRVEHDLFYINNWSVVFDFRILALTPFSVVLENKNVF